MEKWLLCELMKVQVLLENAVKLYNNGMVEAHLKSLHKLMEVLDNPRKEVYIVKTTENPEAQLEKEPGKDTKIAELLSSIVVCDSTDAILSEDSNFNKKLHGLNNKQNMMKLSLGKENSKLTVYIRGEPAPEKPKVRKIYSSGREYPFLPSTILRSHLFNYFTVGELFKLRLVSRQWKTVITDMWYAIFKRELYTQFLVTTFQRELEKNYRLLAIRQPIAEKFFIFATTFADMISWPEVMELCEQEGPLQRKCRLLVTALMKLLFPRAIRLARLREYDDSVWYLVSASLPEDMKTYILNFLQDGSMYPHLHELERFAEDFMEYSEIWMENLSHPTATAAQSRCLTLLRLLIRHTEQYGIVHNNLHITRMFLGYIKDYVVKKKLKIGYKKGFLDGAYKIMVFKSVRIVGKQVIVEDGEAYEGYIMSGMRESQMLTNLLQNLFTSEPVLRGYLRRNRKAILNYPIVDRDLKNTEILANLMSEMETELEYQQSIAEMVRVNLEPPKSPFKKSLFYCRLEPEPGEEDSETVHLGETGEEVKVLNHSLGQEETGLLVKPSFIFERGGSKITVFMDPRATKQFLNDSLRYYDCLRQVKQLTLALQNQFSNIERKIREINDLQASGNQTKSPHPEGGLIPRALEMQPIVSEEDSTLSLPSTHKDMSICTDESLLSGPYGVSHESPEHEVFEPEPEDKTGFDQELGGDNSTQP